ncbi:MAG: phage portal protein [Bacteroidales bacterium]|nr:phage portal protein [Bacteroidales bacterium]
MANIFTFGREMKVLEAKISELQVLQTTQAAQLQERKGYLYGDNSDNEFLRKLLNVTFSTTDFGDFGREELYLTYRTNSAVFGIIDRIAKACGEIGQYIELLDKDNQVVEDNPLIKVLKRPNDRFSLYQFLYAWATNYNVFGDAFVYSKKGIGKDLGSLSGMYVIPSHRVDIEKGGWTQPIKGIKIKGSADMNIITPRDYFQSFIYNLDPDTYFGFSPLIAAAYDCQLLKKGKLRLNTSMDNGGVNAIIAPAKDKDGFVVPQAANDLEKDLNSNKNANRTMFLRQAVEVTKVGSTPVELSILDGSKEAVTALCFAYGIPVDLYYGQSKYENAKEAKKSLYESAAIPLINVFCNDLMNFVRYDESGKEIKQYAGMKLILNTDKIEVLKASTTEVLTNLNLMNATLNEKREAMGYAEIEEDYANKPMLNLGVQFGDMYSPDINENAEA